MRIILHLLLVAVLTAACNSKNKTNGTASSPTENGENHVIAAFKKSFAFGIFPVYNMTIHSNGEVLLEAVQNTEMDPGTYTSLVSQVTIQSLLDKAEEIGFYELEDTYTGEATDLPRRILTLTSEEKTKTVSFSQDFPPGLRDFEKMFDELLKELEWKKS